MCIIDRYVLKLFLKVLVICFASLSGLFIVMTAVGNFDDFLAESQRQGSLIGVLVDYFGPRILSVFDQISSLLCLIAAIFSITLLQRTNEMTAIRAAGIPQIRIVRPLLFAAFFVSLVAVANREVLLPGMRDKLTRRPQDWAGEHPEKLTPRYDRQTGILLGGRQTIARYRRIINPSFRLHQPIGAFERRLAAAEANYLEADGTRPSGYLLNGVEQPETPSQLPSADVDGATVIFSPHDHKWLQPNQLFVASDVRFEQLAHGNTWRHYASLKQLISELHNRSLDYGADIRVTVHARMTQPLLDMTLLLLGLPLILGKQQRNMFVAAGLCILLVLVFYMVILLFRSLGNYGYLVSPALAAWSPLMIFSPFAYASCRPLWD